MPKLSTLLFLLRLARRESSAILSRWDADAPDERGAHMLFVVEAATLSNGFDAASGLHEQASRRVDPNRLNGLGWSPATLSDVNAGKVPRAHVDAATNGFDATVPCRVFCDPQFKMIYTVGAYPEIALPHVQVVLRSVDTTLADNVRANRTPFIASNRSSLSEVLDSAAVPVNPQNVFDIA